MQAYLLAIIVTILLFVIRFTYTGNTEIPDGIKYTQATTSINLNAEKKLQAIFSSPDILISQLVADSVNKNKEIVVGTFLSQYIEDHYPANRLTKGKNRISFRGNIIDGLLLFASDQKQADELSQFLSILYKPSALPVVIRKLNKKEMALIWFYIAWDITEPVYIVEMGNKQLVLDFSSDGNYLEWIEEISEPCFRLGFNDKTRLTPCMCSVVKNEGNHYQVVFEPKKECNAQSSNIETNAAAQKINTDKKEPSNFEMGAYILYQPDSVLQERIANIEEFADYGKKIESVCNDFFKTAHKPENLDIVVALRPNKRSRVWFVSDIPHHHQS